ncbi:MAG: hypothetical protein ACI86X_000894 [Moritella sp.]|jgi:hypothetical protein
MDVEELNDEVKDRLAQLLLHISVDGFDIIAAEYSEDCPLDADGGDDEDNDNDDEQQTALLAYFLSQQPPIAHLVQYCIDSDENVFHQYLIYLGQEGLLFAETGKLSVKKGLVLLDIFDEYDNTASLIAHFKDDPSRKVSSSYCSRLFVTILAIGS